jgi:hypothetical protein
LTSSWIIAIAASSAGSPGFKRRSIALAAGKGKPPRFSQIIG